MKVLVACEESQEVCKAFWAAATTDKEVHMAIKNYTSTVDVFTSLGEIQGALAGHGAR